MASIKTQQVNAIEQATTLLFAELTLDGYGDPTIVHAKGIASAASPATGTLVLTLNQGYSRLLGVSVMGSTSAAEDITFQLDSDDTDVVVDKTVKILCKAAASLTDATGTVYVQLLLKNSSV